MFKDSLHVAANSTDNPHQLAVTGSILSIPSTEAASFLSSSSLSSSMGKSAALLRQCSAHNNGGHVTFMATPPASPGNDDADVDSSGDVTTGDELVNLLLRSADSIFDIEGKDEHVTHSSPPPCQEEAGTILLSQFCAAFRAHQHPHQLQQQQQLRGMKKEGDVSNELFYNSCSIVNNDSVQHHGTDYSSTSTATGAGASAPILGTGKDSNSVLLQVGVYF